MFKIVGLFIVLAIPASAYMGLGAEIEVYVESCQTCPVINANVVILGEQTGVGADKDGFYAFEENLQPGEYTIFVYGSYGEYYRDDFVVVEGMEKIDWRIMLCSCVPDQSTGLNGEVTDKDGTPLSGAIVSIDELFISEITDEKGVYYLSVPPGEWVVTAQKPGFKDKEKKLTFEAGSEDEINIIEHDFKLSK